MIIVTASLLDLSFEMIDGLSVLRCLRLVRPNNVESSTTTYTVVAVVPEIINSAGFRRTNVKRELYEKSFPSSGITRFHTVFRFL